MISYRQTRSRLPRQPSLLRRAMTTAASAVVLVCTPASTVAAQTPAQPAPPPAALPVVAGWNEGFFIQTPNGDNRLQIGLVLQADGRFSIDDPLPITNTFVMRKARPTFTGRVEHTSTSRSCQSSPDRWCFSTPTSIFGSHRSFAFAAARTRFRWGMSC